MLPSYIKIESDNPKKFKLVLQKFLHENCFTFSLCSTVGKNDLHNAPFAVRSHCLCHFMTPFFFSSVAAVVVAILSYTMFCSYSSWAASLASVSALSLPSIPA